MSLFVTDEVLAPEFMVSGYRHVIIKYGKDGRVQQRFAYGQAIQSYTRADAEVRHAPHREFYSDADAEAVAKMLNERAA